MTKAPTKNDRTYISESPASTLGKGGASRREFVENMVGTLVGAAALSTHAPAVALARDTLGAAGTPAPSLDAYDYPPALQGLRGQIQSAMSVGHALRDGALPTVGEDTGEDFDLVVVGAGMSGLAAAYFFRKAFPNAKVLILEACDDFGGHARRNEYNVDGRQVLAAGGTYMMMFPATYTPEGKALIADIGIDPALYYQAAENGGKLIERYGLGPAAYFPRETYGVDRLVTQAKDFTGMDEYLGGSSTTWADFLARAPLSTAAKQDIKRLIEDRADHLPGLTVEQKIARLRTQSYADYLIETLHMRHDAMAYFQNQMGAGLLNVGAGPDSFSAWRAYNAHYPGFAGMNLPPIRVSDIVRDDQLTPDIHLPDGNAGLARLLVRWLIPAALPGKTMEDSVAPHVNYSCLDRSQNEVRIRLSSTVIKAQHDTDAATAKYVQVTYVQDGKTRRVRASTCVMACFNAIVPYLCPELPVAQKDALHLEVRKPLVLSTVAISNWRVFAKLGVLMITSPNSFYYSTLLELGVNLGGYRGAASPDDPAVLLMFHAPSFPGMSAREQYRAGRAKMMSYTLEDYRREVYEQLGRALGPAGFDSQRDIAGVTVNRWAHGYACGSNDLYDPETKPADESWVKARQRFGRITIANSDAAGVSMTQAAIDQANRAVKELVDNVLEPTFYFSNPPRG